MFLFVFGLSYSFVTGEISYVNKTNTKLVSNSLGLTFDGKSEINCTNIVPGDKCSKTFEVTNTSEVETYYNIFMEKITNEFDGDINVEGLRSVRPVIEVDLLDIEY